MPLKRYEIRNEYSLADPELYKVADKDDPEALLEGVAMSGLVGLLRQLGDLAEFAAEIFHDLHEEVMGTAARGHGLIVRVQQLEAEFPLIERKLLSQTSHTSFLYNSGIDWHPNLCMDQTTVTQGDMPRFVMDSYEECRGPPRLFLLDKFDVAGAGACLKRFTDPSFFKVEYASSTGRKPENQWEKRTRRIKKRGPRWKNGDTPESYPSSHAKLHQLFLEERIENGGNDPDRRVKLKKRQFTGSLFDQESTKSYMDKFLETCPPEQKIVHEIIDPLPLTWTSNDVSESGLEIVEIGTVSPVKESVEYQKWFDSSPDNGDIAVKPSMDNFDNSNDNGEAAKVLGLPWKSHDGNISSNVGKMVSSEDIADRESNSEVSVDDDDDASEIDNYMDALATIDSEVETDSECKKHTRYLNLRPAGVYSDGSLEQQEQYGGFLDSQSISTSCTSEDGSNFYKEKENSSCSNSVTASVETTAVTDAEVEAVPSVSASDINRERIFDRHTESQEMTEGEHLCAATSRADDEVGKKLEEISDNSCIAKVLSGDMDAHVLEKSLVSPKLPGNIDSGLIASVSAGAPSYPPETSDGLANLFLSESQNVHSIRASTEEHAEETEMADTDASCEKITWSLEQRAISYPGSTEIVNPVCDFASVPCAQDSAIQTSSGTSECGRGVSSDPTAGHAEISPPIDNKLQMPEPALSSVRISEEADIAECGYFQADGADIGDGEAADDSVKLDIAPISVNHLETEVKHLKLSSENDDATPFLHCPIEAEEQHPGSGTSDGDTVSVGEDESKTVVNMLERYASILSDQTKMDDVLARSDAPEIETIDRVLSRENAPFDLLGNVNAVISNDTLLSGSPHYRSDFLCSVEGADDNAAAVNVMGEVESVQTGVQCPAVTAIHDDHDAVTSFEQTHLFEQENFADSHGHVAESMHLHGVPSEANSHHKHVQTPECIENEGWIDTAASYQQSQPFMSKPPPQSVQQTLENVREAMTQSYAGNSDCHMPKDAMYANQLDSRPQVSSPDFPAFGSLPSESQLNQEAPPLPPLPPMQWRLGRFQNSSASPSRQIMQPLGGHVQAQPVLLPALQHMVQTISPAIVPNTLAPAQPIALPTVQYTLAPIQPLTLPAQHHTVVPVQPVAPITLADEVVTTAQTSCHSSSSDGYVAPGGLTLPILIAASESSSHNVLSATGRSDHVLLSVPSTSGYMSPQGGFSQPLLATVSEGSSQNSQLIFVHSMIPQSGSDISHKYHQLNGDPDSDSLNEIRALEQNVSVVEVRENAYVGAENELYNPSVTEQEAGNLYLQFPPSSKEQHPSAGFMVSEADRTWLSTYDEGPSHAGGNANGALQKKLPRPRNPLIDEVVAIDKSKLRKVERVKQPLESKSEDGESLREQLQLRKVERGKPPEDTKTSDGGSILEQLQLRKVGERVKPQVERNPEEREFLPEQLQLRKVVARVKSEAEQKVEETESPRVQLRKVSQRVKQEIDTKIEGTESPRIQLRKVAEKVQPLVGPAEERDSLFEQIRTKSFSLKPAVAARPNMNIQGPRTNLKVAAILEKASNIRQAMVGSDEDDDADTWSDC